MRWDWRGAGALHAAAVLDGDWWRTVTALTLHGDLGHLLGNTLFGIVFGWFIGRYLGSGFGWLLIVAAGAIANYCNAMLQPEAFRAIGKVLFALLKNPLVVSPFLGGLWGASGVQTPEIMARLLDLLARLSREGISQEIELKRLEKEQAEQLIDKTLGRTVFSEEIKKHIADNLK